MLATVRLSSSRSPVTCTNTIRHFSRVKYPKPLKTKQFGIDILHDSLWNKGMAFNRSERDRLGQCVFV